MCHTSTRAVVVVEGATVRPFLNGDATMIVLGILGYLATIAVLCWLVFTLAVYALPFLAGLTAGGWALETGAGWPGAIAIGVVAGGLTLGLGQVLLGVVRPLWAQILVALAFVAPAAVAGFHASHGIVKHMMPSETWQLVFSVIGALAVGATTWLRITRPMAPGGSGGNLARG